MSEEQPQIYDAPGTQSHKRSTYRHGPREYLLRIMRENPALDKDGLFPLYQAEVLKHPDWMSTVVQYYFDAQHKYATTEQAAPVKRAARNNGGAKPASPEEIAAALRAADDYVATAIEFYAIDGVSLLDCTGKRIREQAAHHLARSDNHRLRARFLTAVAADLGDDDTPRAAGKEEATQKLFAEFFG
jgi:hypothetical protein